MACLRCGSQYMKVVGRELRCPKCGHIQEGKVPDPVDLIESSELAIWDIIYKMHREGVRFEIIHQMMIEMVKTLELQGYAENWLEQYLPEEGK